MQLSGQGLQDSRAKGEGEGTETVVWFDVFEKVSLNNFARLRYDNSPREMAHDKQWRSVCVSSRHL